jgi:RHS repeat-associated protein
MDVLQDRNSDGTTTNYVNGLGIDNKLKQTTGTTSRYFLTDHLGSTMGMADSSGNIAESAIYDSFGRTISSTLTTRYQYTGREYDEYTGLMFYRARFYDPQIGRFISEDPIGFRGGINQFTYVGNDPLIYIDPYGYQGTYSGYQGMPTPRMWPPLPRAGEDSLLGQGNSPVLPPRDPYWRDPNDVAWEAQFKRFKEIDPYGGAYRHCVAACLLKRYQGPIGILQRHLWDWFHENPNDLNSIGDMYGEDTGLDCADKNGPCEVECLHKYPSPVQEGESPRWVPGGSIPTWE